MVKLTTIWNNFYYSFPLQLLFNNFKRNHVLLLCWILLIAMITGNFGKYLGIPYLFLDPEYLNEVNFTSFFFVGKGGGRGANAPPALQMFTGVYRVSAGKSECGDFKFMGIACYPQSL